MSATRRDALKALGAAGVLSVVGAGAATAQEGNDDDDEVDLGADEAAVRVAHASPDAPDVDVLVDGEPAFTGVAYGSVTEYATLPTGTYTVTITAAGDRDTVAFEGDITVEPGYFTVAAVGELAEDTFEPAILEDGNAALVRLYHASPDAPAVDVGVEDTEFVPFEDVSFGQVTDYATVAPGSYTLAVRPAGDDEADPVATFDVELERGTVYSAYATGYLAPEDAAGDEEFDLVVAEDPFEQLPESADDTDDDGDDMDDDGDDMDDGTGNGNDDNGDDTTTDDSDDGNDKH
ncbi:DUF4397 domain-containing protein [Halostella salina]|uniref:DUF4397 domain-containing protein n=1 Tax=Halostella salina TaxID=1547897 RepID=UPI000EF76E67|nr:DUF4397 domain-containing protein [Halostella salina]